MAQKYQEQENAPSKIKLTQSYYQTNWPFLQYSESTMGENENSASILVKSGLISISTKSPIGYFSKFANELYPMNDTTTNKFSPNGSIK